MQYDSNQSQRIELLICQVDDRETANALRSIEIAIELIHRFKGTVFHIVGPIIIATFDFGGVAEDEAARARDDAARDLTHTLGQNVKVIHGPVAGSYGNIGAEGRLSFGPFIPGIQELISRLGDLPFCAKASI